MDQEHSDLTDEEKLLIEKIRDDSVDEVKRLFLGDNIRINCYDTHGMTPLQHASYKGNYEICKFLLDNGADVNWDKHESGYTALMFAGLAKNLSVVSLLLENGALTTAVNSINRTASQLAAFVGNHEVVSMINNFIPKEEIDYYTEIHYNESEPKLPLSLAKSTHRFVVMININPVKLCMFLQKNMCLFDEFKKVKRVLEHMSGKQLNDNGNELISMKLHHLAFVLSACHKFLEDLKQKPKKTESSRPLEPLMKHWLKWDEDDGFPVTLEKFLRQSIREYPFLQCSLFQQLVRTLGPVEVGNEPSAISIFCQAISGQRGMEDSVCCFTCSEPAAEKKCSGCKAVQYCGRNCQKLHWFTHKTVCQNLNKKRLKEEEEMKKEDTECEKKVTEDIKCEEKNVVEDIKCEEKNVIEDIECEKKKLTESGKS